MDNQEEKLDKFLKAYSPPKLNQEEIVNLNRLITRSEIESVKTNKKQNKKTPYEPKSRTRWLHTRILPNIQRRTYSDPSQTLAKDSMAGYTPEDIL